MKKSVIAMIIAGVAVFCVIGTVLLVDIMDESDDDAFRNTKVEKINAKEFTVEELSHFNGLNSQPSYIAVDGVVYDVSAQFINGEHNGIKAGQDVSALFHDEHDKDKLENSPVMGHLKGSINNVAPTSDEITKMNEELAKLKIQEMEIELQQDKLEISYKNGDIDYNTYQAQKIELDTQENNLEFLQDEIENKLEQAGYDD